MASSKVTGFRLIQYNLRGGPDRVLADQFPKNRELKNDVVLNEELEKHEDVFKNLIG